MKKKYSACFSIILAAIIIIGDIGNNDTLIQGATIDESDIQIEDTYTSDFTDNVVDNEDLPVTFEPDNDEDCVLVGNTRTYGDYYYDTYEKDDVTSVVIIHYNGSNANVTIPDTIEGYPVRIIGENAFSYNSKIENVNISDNVTEIKKSAFTSCTNLTTVKLSNNLEVLENNAFDYTKLQSITIPKSLKDVWCLGGEANAFGNCSYLTNAIFENGTTEIPDDIFFRAKSLTTVVIPNTVKSIGNDAFSGCTGLTSITIPNSVKEIMACAFSDCSQLTDVRIPANLESLGANAFRKTAIRSIYIPKSLKNIEYYEYEDNAFGGCEGLTEIEFEQGIAEIPERLFAGLDSLTSISLPNSITCIDSDAFAGCKNLTEVVMPQGLKSIKGFAFGECVSLEEINIPNSVNEISETAFLSCSGLKKITINANNTKFDSRDNCNAIIETQTNTLILGCKNTTIPNSVTSIGDIAFEDCTGLKSITIPNSVTNIGTYAFSKCTGLSSIDIPNSITSMGYGVFFDCKGLEEVILHSGLKVIGVAAFRGTNIKSVFVPKGIKVSNDNGGPFSNSSLSTIEFEDGIEEIPAYLFSGAGNLKTVIIPDTVTSIGEDAFASCGLEEVFLSNNLISIGNNAFFNCDGLENIILPKKLESVGEFAFSYCDSLKSVSFPNSIKKMGQSAFGECPKLTEVVLPSGLTDIAWGLFSGDTELEKVTIPAGLKSIGTAAFSGCTNLSEINLPEGIITIGGHAFFSCERLNNLYIPSSVKTIGNDVFSIDYENKMSISCKTNTYAYIYAKENNVPYKAEEAAELSRIVLNEANTWYYFQAVNDVIKASISFELTDEYISSVQRKLKIKLPSNSVLAESSLCLNDEICRNYDYNNDIISVPINKNSGTLTFDISKTNNQEIFSYALFTFALNGEKDYEIINVLDSIDDGLLIEADEIINKRSFSISGWGPKGETINLFIDGKSQGTLKASKGGRYSGVLTISSPRNGDLYLVSAECNTNNKKYNAETSVLYMETVPEVTDFRLYYNNHQDTSIDLMDENIVPYVSFDPHCPFTFTATIDNNDVVEKVYITSTRNNEKRSMEAQYDEASGCYVATGYFDESNHSYVPGTIRVEYQLKQENSYKVQDTIPENVQADIDKLAKVLTETTTTVVKKEAKKEEYSFDIGESLSKVDEKLKEVVLDYTVSVYDSKTDGNLGDFLGMTESAFELAKYIIPGIDNSKYAVALDYSDPTTYTMIVKDVTGAANSFMKYSLSLQGGGEWTSLNDITPAFGLLTKTAGLVNTLAQNAKAHDSRKTQIEMSPYIKDKSEALRKNDELYNDQDNFAKLMLVYALLPAAIGLSGPVAIGLTALTGVIGACSGFFWDCRIADMMGKSMSVRWAIDPSGYVYSQVLDNRLENVKVTALYKEKLTDPAETVWNAAEYDQNNPLYTDAGGNYAWDVPEGFWKVRAELDGYQTAETDWMEVPPPRTDVAIRMKPTSKPKITGAKAYADHIRLIFDQYMDPETVSGIKLATSEGAGIRYTLSYDQNQKDEKGTVFARTFLLTYQNYRVVNGETITINAPNTVKNADGIAMDAKTLSSQPALSAFVQSSLAMKAGTNATISFSVDNYDPEIKYNAISDAPYTASITGVNVSGTGEGKISVQGKFPGETKVTLYDSTGDSLGETLVSVVRTDEELAEAQNIRITGLTLSSSKLTLPVGGQVIIPVTIAPENAPNNITWESSNDTVVKVTKSGLVTAVAEGKAVVTVKAADGGAAKASCEVTVEEFVADLDTPPEGIYLDESSYDLFVGDTLLLNVKARPEDASLDSLKYSSENPEVASVDGKGTVKAEGVGETTITITVDGTKISTTCKINVYEKADYCLVVKQTVTLKAGKTVKKWTSSDSSIAKVKKKSKNKCTVTAKGAGYVTITGLDGKGNTVVAKKVYVEKPTLKQVNISRKKNPANGSVFSIYDYISGVRYGGEPTSLKSSDKKVLFVSKSGDLVARKNGKGTITVSYGKAKYIMTFKVAMPAIKQTSIKMKKGKKKAYTLQNLGKDDACELVINKTNIAAINEDGTIQGLAKGTAKLSLVVDGEVYDTCKIKVTK